jgi:DNA-binding MarR family transcriptional regulator
MSINKEIHQQHFRNEKQKAMVNILFTYGWLMERIKNILLDDDITVQQYNILRILRGSNPVPLSTLQIRERMIDKMSDTSRLVDRLVVKKLVKKVISRQDRRLVDVTITARGMNLLKKLDKRQEEIDSIVGNLSEKDSNNLSKLLDKIRSNHN